jgi:hypothetical protein
MNSPPFSLPPPLLSPSPALPHTHPHTVCDPATTCSGHGTCTTPLDGSCHCSANYSGDAHCSTCGSFYFGPACGTCMCFKEGKREKRERRERRERGREEREAKEDSEKQRGGPYYFAIDCSANVTCSNHGTCYPLNGTCNCKQNFTGKKKKKKNLRLTTF